MSLGIEKLLGFNPLQIQPSERVDGGGRARGVQPGTEVGGGSNPFAAISRIDGELKPNNGQSGSSYTSGLGHSNHTLRLLG